MTLPARLLHYGFTGGAAAVVDLGGFCLLIWLHTGVALAAGSSFSVAVIVNYALTSRLVFNRAASARAFGLFVLFAIVGLCINVGLTTMFAGPFGWPAAAAKAAAIGITFFVNFSLNNWLVFARD